MRQMTDEEKRLVEDNRWLVPFVMKRMLWGLSREDWEDYEQVGMIGLCRAAMSWDPKQSKFSCYAYRGIEFALRMQVRYCHQECRDTRRETISLDEMLIKFEKEEFTLSIREIDQVENVLSAMNILRAIELLDSRERIVVDMLARGMSQRNIGKVIGVTQSHVSRIVRKIRKRIAEEVCA